MKKTNNLLQSKPSIAQCVWALANSYSDAANLLLQNPAPQVFIPALYLLAHSLELHFKAFLISKGIEEKKLKNHEVGHNLTLCLKLCKKHGLYNYLSFSLSQARQIIKINRYYQEKQLEYFTASAKQFGSIEYFQEIVSQTSKAIFNPITDEDFYALSKMQPNPSIKRDAELALMSNVEVI